MIIETLQKIFKRDLEKLKQEIASYRDENNLWVVDKSIANSAGNLCLHLVGNLNTYIGEEIGKTGYVRNRDLEFSLKNIPKKQLLENIAATVIIVDKGLQYLNGQDLEREYPLVVFEKKTTIEYFLVHLSAHLAYHLGQVNYCRRLLDQE